MNTSPFPSAGLPEGEHDHTTHSAGDSLLEEIQATLENWDALLEHAVVDQALAQRIRDARRDIGARLSRDFLAVAVVGEKKAGKSTYLNALLGARVLGSAARECTGTITYLRRGERPNYVARFQNGSKEEFCLRFPDLSAEYEAPIRQLEAEVQHLEVLYAQAAEQLARWQSVLEEAQRNRAPLERALAVCLAELAAVEATADAAERSEQQEQERLEACKAALPSVFLRDLPWWAIWSWCLRALLFAFVTSQREAYGRQLTTCDQTRAARVQAEALLDSRQGQRASCESSLEELAGVLENARSAIDLRRSEMSDVLNRRPRLLEEIAERRKQLETYQAERLQSFAAEVKGLTDMNKRGHDVLELHLEFPTTHIPPDLVFIDTPGVNTDNEENQARAWKVIETSADGCILLSDMQQALSQSTRDFIARVQDYVPHLVLVMTKMDRALENARDSGDGDPWEQIAEAKKVATKRFATAIGRNPDQILALGVASEQVLSGGDGLTLFQEQFMEEHHRLVELLKRERAAMLGARAVRVVRSTLPLIERLQDHAEHTYREQIQSLEARRAPLPAEFARAELVRVQASAGAQVEEIGDRLGGKIAEEGAGQLAKWTEGIGKTENLETLKAQLEKIHKEAKPTWQAFRQGVDTCLMQATQGAMDTLLMPAMEALTRVYQISDLTTTLAMTVREPEASTALVLWGETDHQALAKPAKELTDALQQSEVTYSVIGVLVGAIIGNALDFRYSVYIFAAVGFFVARAILVQVLKDRAVEKLKAVINALSSALRSNFDGGREVQLAHIVTGVGARLDAVLSHHSVEIQRLLELEETAIRREEQRLAGLLSIRGHLAQHSERIDNLMAQAFVECLGLCQIKRTTAARDLPDAGIGGASEASEVAQV